MNETSWNKIAQDYHKFIISPFQQGVKNPLFKEIKKTINKKNKIIAEFGCGRLEIGNFLSKNFKEVYAFDFSEKMIEEARNSNNSENITIKKLDTTKLKIKNKFDVAISINSLIMPKIIEIKRALKNINYSLKKEGKLFLIVPSMESILYEGMLILNKNLTKLNEKKIINQTKKIHENEKYDYFLGTYRDEKDTQKFFYKHEIIYFLEKTGFKNISIRKVEYPWKKEISDYEQFPEEEPLWDWFVSCEK